MDLYDNHMQALADGPSDESREAACQTSFWACMYTKEVDKCPRPDTRRAACKDSEMALEYAIFEGPHDVTRRAACKNPGTAYKYALNVDKCYRPDTYEATYADSFWKAMYNRYVPHTENFL